MVRAVFLLVVRGLRKVRKAKARALANAAKPDPRPQLFPDDDSSLGVPGPGGNGMVTAVAGDVPDILSAASVAVTVS